jgi:hypothetical protein
MLIAASIVAWFVVGLGVAIVFGLVAQLNQQPSPRAQESAQTIGVPAAGKRPRRRIRAVPRASGLSVSRSR